METEGEPRMGRRDVAAIALLSMGTSWGAGNLGPVVPDLETANPVLVPLETLYGRDHYDFPTDEEPPWRWTVDSVYAG